MITVFSSVTVGASSTGGLPGATGTAVDAGGGSKGFFHNTGAVAGVFSVAGLIVLAVVIALVTNGIRRRRARRFDRELAAATLEAASAPKPVFLDDDDEEYPGAARGGYGSSGAGNDMGYGQFSDASSHGTYAQPAMSVGSHGGESYGMRELGSGQSMGHAAHSVGPGEIFDPYAIGAAGAGGAAGAAGIGVARARSGRVAGDANYAAGLQEGGAPYAAFAVPTGSSTRPPMPQQSNPADLLEAAGMGAHAAGAGSLSRGQSVSQQQYNSQFQPYPASQQQTQMHQRSPSSSANPIGDYANLDRNRSMGSNEMSSNSAYTSSSDPYGQYPPQQRQGGFAQYEEQNNSSYTSQSQSQSQHQYGQFGHYQQQQSHQQQYNDNRYSVTEDDDAYGGYVVDEPSSTSPGAGKLPNPFGPEGVERERERDSSADEDDEPRRVLKVANE